jgi:hypothetical protein
VSGKWRDGKPVDDVTIIDLSGLKYIGSVKEDFQADGYGTYFLKGIKVYAYWENSEPVGKVTMTFDDGGIYEGEVKDMREHGKGVRSFPNGMRYEGDFINGGMTGYGIVTNCDGEIIFPGLFKDGKYIGGKT